MRDDTEIRLLRREEWTEFSLLNKEVFPNDATNYDSFVRIVDDNRLFGLFSHDNILVGFVSVAYYGDTGGHLPNIGVKTSEQNHGLGSKLMQFAINWFRQHNCSTIILYTQHDNYHAQHLYKKFGFKIAGTSWHYFVPFSSVTPTHKCQCTNIKEDEIAIVEAKYPASFPPSQIQRHLESEHNMVLVLKDETGKIVGACRFSPGFPGCFPFEIDRVDFFDDFVSGISNYSTDVFDYVRVVFSDNEELAQLCDSRDYKLHHKLFKMILKLDEAVSDACDDSTVSE